MSLHTILLDYGFSEKEASVYLTCLELGTAPVSSIARLLKDNRVTVYSTLKNLVKRGVATETSKQKNTYYSVIWPEKLLQKLEDKYAALKNALPEFLAIANRFDNKPKVQFFEGFEGVKQAYENILTSSTKTIYAFLGIEVIAPKLLEYLNLQFLPKRNTLGIDAKVLLCKQDNKSGYRVYKNNPQQFLTEYREIEADFVRFHSEINIYGDNMVLFILFRQDEMSALTIQSKTLYDTMKSIFDLNWLIAWGSWIPQRKEKNPSHSKKKTPLSKASSSKKR